MGHLAGRTHSVYSLEQVEAQLVGRRVRGGGGGGARQRGGAAARQRRALRQHDVGHLAQPAVRRRPAARLLRQARDLHLVLTHTHTRSSANDTMHFDNIVNSFVRFTTVA